MKNIIKYILCLLLTFLIMTNVNALELNIKSKTAILYDTKDNEVMYQKNENDKVQIASLTKIMTATIVLEKEINLDKKIILTKDDFKGLLEQGLATAGFKQNQTVTIKDLLYGLLLPSGADAAQALTRIIAGNGDKFVKLMNEKVTKLNLKNTHFSNPIGLDDDDNYSTAKEVAAMFKYALQNEEFKKIITTKSYTTTDGTLTFNSSVNKKSNGMSYILGGKTGTTDGAGLCLASIATIDNMNFLLVTTGAPYDKKGQHNITDAKTIYDYFINNYEYKTIITTKDKILTLKTKYTKNDEVDFYPEKDIKEYVPKNISQSDVTYKYEGIKTITSKMYKGDKLGKLQIIYDDKTIKTIDIFLKERQNFDVFKYIGENKIVLVYAAILIILIFLIIRTISKRKTRRKYGKQKR